MYKIFLALMTVGYLGVSFYQPDLRMKLVGILIAVANLLIFYR